MSSLPTGQVAYTRRNILSNIAVLFSGSAIAQAINAITFILIARQLGPAQYGQYTGSMVLATFCSILFNLGLNLWLLREGGRNPRMVSELSSSVLVIKTVIGSVWLVFMFILAQLLDSSSLPKYLISLSAITIWLNSIFITILTAFRAILRNRISSSLEVIAVSAMLITTIAMTYNGVDDIAQYMIARVIILILSLLITAFLFWRLIHINPTRTTTIRALSDSPPYAASEFLAGLYMRADVLIIAFVLNEYAVGLYAPAEGIINALYLVPASINMVMLPVLSNLFSSNLNQAWITAKRVIILLAGIGFSLSIAVLLGGKYIILLLGTSFSGSLEILHILSIILFIHSISFGVAAIIVATNQQTKRSVIQGITAIINIVFSFLVIQTAGIRGVAFVYVFSEILLLLGYSWIVLRYSRKHYSILTSSV